MSPMRGQFPGFLNVLQDQLESLGAPYIERVNRDGGLDLNEMLDFMLKPRDHTVDQPDDIKESLLIKQVDVSHDVRKLGEESLASGKTGVVLLTSDAVASHVAKVVWKMTSKETSSDNELRHFETFGLTPLNQLQLRDGKPVLHPCGSGDVIAALIHSGELRKFLSNGGEHIVVIDAKNDVNGPCPKLIGQHIVAKKPITCEVVERRPGDRGVLLCEHAGFNQMVDDRRLSSKTVSDQYSWIGTGVTVIDARLDFTSFMWPWHRTKQVSGGELIIKYERHINDLTSHYQAQFVLSPRALRYNPKIQ